MRELCPYISEDDNHSILKHYKNNFEYLGVDYCGKAVLNIRADLWFPANAEIKGTILYYLKGISEPVTVEKTFVDRIYPNKKIVSITKRFGRKKAKKGIPIVFDSFEELCKVERIEVIWKIEAFCEKVIVDYPVRFEEPRQDCIFSLWTYDKTILSVYREKSDLSIIDGKLEGDSCMSVYDDFYFMALHDDSIVVIEELHKPDSSYRIDFDKIENMPVSIVNAVLRNKVKAECSEADDTEAVYFYHSELLLNDYTA